MIDPGELRTLLVYQRPQSEKDGHGQAIKTWVDVATIRGRVKPLVGREGYWAKQVNAQLTHEVITRFRPWIKPDGRFRIAGTSRTLEISGAFSVDEMGVWAVASCIEAVPGGAS